MPKIVAKCVGDKIVIEMPIDLLVFACEHNPENPLTVFDKEEFAQYVEKNILHFGGDSETGLTEFEMFLDEFFVDMCESGGPVGEFEDVEEE